MAYVDDVMKAIKKTEESLRKLKKIRDPNYKVNSDDDKIRFQLSLDIDYLLLSVSKIYVFLKFKFDIINYCSAIYYLIFIKYVCF